MSDLIRYEVDPEGIAVITLDRPEKRNAMTRAMLDDFLAAVRRASNDGSVRVIIVTGSGGSFCAGADLAELRGRAPEDHDDYEPELDPTARFPLLILTKPVIAAVDGPAVGMGAEFTSHCDVRIASDRARFAWNFVHRGLVPDTGAGTWLLPRLIGVTEAVRLLYSGEFLSAGDALALGYVSRVVAPEALIEAAREEARRYLSGSPFAIRRAKELVYGGLDRDLPAHLAAHEKAMQECYRSNDHQEGIAAFLERRPARFTGT